MTEEKKHEEEPFRLKQIEEELNSFHDYCKQQNLCQEDIKRICNPLRQRELRFIRIILFVVVLGMIIYYLSSLEMVNWHASALGRIIMIKILPFYDWQHLKDERCLVKRKPVDKKRMQCFYCETIESLYFTTIMDPEHIKKHYLDYDMPVIFTHDVAYNSSKAVLDGILGDSRYTESLPCKLATNLKTPRQPSIGELLDRLDNKKFFMHYQNCGSESVKRFRLKFPRPKYFVPEVSPVQYTWILASNGYHPSNFKSLALRDRIASIEQLVGSNIYNVHPVMDCRGLCNSMQIELLAGEGFLLTDLWDLEYKPANADENFAVIYEAH